MSTTHPKEATGRRLSRACNENQHSSCQGHVVNTDPDCPPDAVWLVCECTEPVPHGPDHPVPGKRKPGRPRTARPGRKGQGAGR